MSRFDVTWKAPVREKTSYYRIPVAIARFDTARISIEI